MSKHREIEFQGNKYILVGGAIATVKQYENFEDSYAHLGDDGIIMRYGNVIGKKEDIVFLDSETEADPTWDVDDVVRGVMSKIKRAMKHNG